MKQEYDPLSLFDVEAASGASSRDAGLLPVARMAFLGSETASWETLFDGFDTLHAVTYSTGMEFLCALVKRFERAEVVFGYDGVLSFAVHEVLAYQLRTIERLRESLGRHQDALLARLDEGSLRFMVARERLSHEKVYLLSAKDGRRRVITGSANLSRAAFSGRQRENICCLDDEAAYEWYKEGYDALCESSSDEISVRALAVADDAGHADEIPIAGTVMVKKALVVEAEAEATEAVRFALDVKNLSGKLAPYMPKADRKGKWLLAPETVRRTRRLLSEAATQEKELRSEYPALEIDAANGAASLNGGPLDLNPAPEAVAADVALFLEYMDGYARFHGGVEEMQQRYYAFANWFFASPLLAVMRDMAVRYNQNLLPYPVFGLVYGQSKAGKTSFLETLLKMMIGQKTKLAAPDFTRSSIEQLKRKVKGAPIIVDDLTQTRFNQHAVETIKNDDFGVAEGLIHYPAVVISANEDVKAVAPEIVRRTVICRAQAGLKNTELMRNNVVRRVQRGIGTALYRAYLGEMLGRMPSLLDELRDDEGEGAPDILAASSETLKELLGAYGPGKLPHYVSALTLDDYFSERVTGAQAIKTIRDAWIANPKAFIIDKRRNELRYNAMQVHDANNILKELPEDLMPHKSREWVIMRLDRASAFFSMDFRKGFLDTFRGR